MTVGRRYRLYAALGGAALLAGCAGEVNRHGQLFTDVDLEQVRPGMSKNEVNMMLGSPNTKATVGDEAHYYISSTTRTRPMGRPQVIDRKIVAVYFDESGSVSEVANYGLKDGRVFNFVSNETPSRGKEVSLLEQMFGNLGARRKAAIDQANENPLPGPRPDPGL